MGLSVSSVSLSFLLTEQEEYWHLLAGSCYPGLSESCFLRQMDSLDRTILVCLSVANKALTPYLGPCKNFLKYFEIRPFYLHLESPVSPAYRSRGWWTHKTKGKGELCISSPSPKIPLKSLWSVPSGIMQIAWGNPKIVFSPDKHLGQKKRTFVPSQWTEFCLNLRKVHQEERWHSACMQYTEKQVSKDKQQRTIL